MPHLQPSAREDDRTDHHPVRGGRAHQQPGGLHQYVTLPLELPPEIVDGCNALGGGCPVAEDETRSLTAEFVVDSPLNNIKPFIQLKIVNEEKTVVMCVRTQVDLQNPQNP